MLKKSVYKRTLDNITAVIIAFEGLAKLFEKNDEALSLTELPKIDSQIGSASNNKSFSENRYSINKNDSEITMKNNRTFQKPGSKERKFTKVSTLTEKNLKPIKRLNHSIKDAKFPHMIRTPIKSVSDKIDDLNTKIGIQKFTNLSESMKETKTSIPKINADSSRNHSIFAPSTDDRNEMLHSKLENNSKRKAPVSASFGAIGSDNFRTLSYSRQKNKSKQKDKDLVMTSSKLAQNTYSLNNPVKSLIDPHVVQKKRKSSAKKNEVEEDTMPPPPSSGIRKLYKSSKRMRSSKGTRIITTTKKPSIKAKLHFRKYNRSANKNRQGSENSRNDSAVYNSPHHSLQLSMNKDSSGQNKLIEKSKEFQNQRKPSGK